MAAASDVALRRSPLHDRHVALRARMVPFAGWEMPVQYLSVREEHLVVREAAGMFDVSHMGQVETAGPQASALLQRLLSNEVDAVGVGGAQYSLLCREDGGVLDDLISYRLEPERWLTVTNASNHERDHRWIADHAAGVDAEAADRRDDFAMIAVQGPLAREIVQACAGAPLPPRMTAGWRRLAGIDALVCGTGYTGEDGVEVLCPPEVAGRLWDEFIRRGARPCGLGARDTLRIDACFPLYGHELTETRTPIAAGLGWACKEQTGFVGSEAVAAARRDGPPERLAAFVIDGSGIARAGNEVVGGGVVTSGTFSPSLGAGVGMAYLSPERAEPGTRIEIDVRGRRRPATVHPKPLFRRPSPKKER